MEDYTRKVGSCVTRYVKQLTDSSARVSEMQAKLTKGKPFVETEFMVVAMIDVSGYSALTSELAKRGKIASELITQSIASFLNKIIEILALFEGDIVKFLGDAMLITFSASTASKSDTQESICLRALQCSLKVLRHLSEFEIDLSAYDNIGEINKTAMHTDRFTSSLKSSPSADGGTEVSHTSTRSHLRMHMALAAGDISRLVIGIPEERLDYSVFGDPMKNLGEILDNTKAGELGMNGVMYKLCQSFVKVSDSMRTLSSGSVVVGRRGTLDLQLPPVSEKIEQSLRKIVLQSSDNESSIGPCETIVESLESLIGAGPSMLNLWSKFMNQSLLYKYRTNQASVLHVDDGEKGAYTSLPSYRNTLKSKPAGRKGVAGESEFRVLTTLFVKMSWNMSAESAQTCLETFLTCLRKYSGVLQQFSVDDKGQTMLAFFGLPPLNQPNNAKQAVLAAQLFMQTMRARNMQGFTIAIATGDLLFSTIGNSIRAEASFLGDTVNIAARLLNVETNSIVVDERSYQLLSTTFPWIDLGYRNFKGMVDPIQVYKIDEESGGKELKAKPSLMIGYNHERELLLHGIESWLESEEQFIGVVEGESGCGKSTLLGYVTDYLTQKGLKSCIAQGSESEQMTPYFGLQNIVSFIFRILIQGNALTTTNGSQALTRSRRSSLRTKVGASIESVYRTEENVPAWVPRLSVRRLSGVSNPDSARSGGKESSTVQQSLFSKENGIKFMNIIGDHPDMAPLLKNILPVMPFYETEKAKSLDGKSRNFLLKSIVIKALVSYFTRQKHNSKAVFIFDDAQWIDGPSLEIISEIIRVCPKACILIFTRPTKQYNLQVVKSVLEMPETRHIVLNGLPKEDVRNILLEKVRSNGVTSLDDSIVDNVFEKTAGRPLLVGLIADSLHHKLDDFCDIREGKLLFKQKRKSIDCDIFSDNISSLIQSQFDGLEPMFQRFLKVASYFNQYFNLNDVAFVSPEPYEPYMLLIAIKKYDVYNYLVPRYTREQMDASRQDNGESTAMDEFEYFFRHSTIQNYLYESQPYSDRLVMHEAIGGYYEELLTPETWNELIPIISYHYSRSSNLEKHVDYTEQLGLLQLDHYLITDCQATFLELLNLAEKSRAKIEKQIKGANEILYGLRGAKWHIALAVSYQGRLDAGSGTKYALECLQRAGYNMPNKKWAVNAKLVSTVLSVWRLWKRTKGGRINGEKLHSNLTSRERAEHDLQMQSLGCIREMYYWGQTITKGQYLLAVFESMKISIIHCKDEPVEFLLQCLRMSFLLYWVAPKLAAVFRTRYDELYQELQHTGSLQMDSLTYFLGMVDLARGYAHSSAIMCLRFMANRKACGDTSGVFHGYMNASLPQFLSFSKGFDVSCDHMIKHFDNQLRLNIWQNWCTGLVMIAKRALLQGDRENGLFWIKTLEANAEILPADAKKYYYVFYVIKLTEKALDGDIEFCADFLSKLATELKVLDRFFPSSCSSTVFATMMAVVPILPDAISKRGILNQNHRLRDKIVAGYEGMLKVNGFMHKKLHSQPNYWAWLVCKAILNMLRDPLRSTTNFDELRHMLKDKKWSQFLDEFQFIKGFVAGMISKVSVRVEEREVLGKTAVDIFMKPGYKTLAKWADKL
ncbi:Adenylate cyclase type 10 [Chytridiales sp. JEL 0842]|nr:Adenylate cyclase type 10 [Chytridiales sp. JEL 0842]